eukprot:COSAG04_NODE_3377_length_2875_cov_1.735951_3_plen_74_part_00
MVCAAADDMTVDENHCTANFTGLAQLLKPLGFKTHAIGKWDVGFMQRKCTATYRGFDTFCQRHHHHQLRPLPT